MKKLILITMTLSFAALTANATCPNSSDRHSKTKVSQVAASVLGTSTSQPGTK